MPVTTSHPAVSIGVPTYNRLDQLRRAIDSVLAQDETDVEVVISDNASTDGTREWCEQLTRKEPRVRYIRQPSNLGANANINAALRHARGLYYMVLGDDDWIEPSFVRQCANALRAEPDLAVACGTVRLVGHQAVIREAQPMNLLHSLNGDRVVDYFRQVVDNGVFHGLMQRELIASLPPMPAVLAGDWLHVARLAFLGKIRTVQGPALYKSTTGTSGDWETVARHERRPSYQAKLPYLVIMVNAFRDVAWSCPVYAREGRPGRVALALRVSAVLSTKFAVWGAGALGEQLRSRRFTVVSRRTPR